jgi:hypothetical protein
MGSVEENNKMKVHIRCRECGIACFIMPIETDPRTVICNGCMNRIKQNQKLPGYNIPPHRINEPDWME